MNLKLYRKGKRLFYGSLDLIARTKQLLGYQGSLPDFIILGGMKCGSTSLFHYLKEHPQLFGSYFKEVDFFNNYYDKRLDWYKMFFVNQGKKKRLNALAFEADPAYLYDSEAPNRIAENLPNIKLIVLLRNPVDRTISEYYHHKRTGHNYEFEEAMMSGRYSKKSMYAKYLRVYFKLFPREQFLLLSSEEFYKNTQASLKRIFQFLGVDEKYRVQNLRPRLKGMTKEPVDSEILISLRQRFKKPNEELFEMIGDSYDWD
ncbi:MAG: sulfotransferase domain-containing protein [Cyclobacteriaceae bacterium]